MSKIEAEYVKFQEQTGRTINELRNSNDKLRIDIENQSRISEELKLKLAQAEADVRAALVAREGDQKRMDTIRMELANVEREDSELLARYKEREAELQEVNQRLLAEKSVMEQKLVTTVAEFDTAKRNLQVTKIN